MRISLFCILCLLLGACSNEEMIPSTSEGGEECAFQFLLRVPGTIDVAVSYTHLTLPTN